MGPSPALALVLRIAVCAGAVGLAALLGAAMTPAPRRRPRARCCTHGSRELCGAPRRRHRRPRALSARAARRSALEPDPRPLPRCHRRCRSYFYASDIAEFEKYRYELDDAIKAGDVEPAFVIFRRYPAAQPRAHGLCDRAARQEAGLRHRRILHFRSRERAVAGQCRGDERAVAQAGQERCAFAR